MSNPATVGNLAQYVGESKEYLDSIVDVNGDPQDITGWSATMTVYAYGDPSTVFFTLMGTIQGAATLGVFSFVVPPSYTSGMRPDQYGFVIERTDGSGNPPANAAVPTVGLLTLLPGSTFST